ncbi:hypothetical protein [Novosphingobium sp. ST904]|uniref:hypothetical protein n=1 Tax=Novosphingobium sp. ST904 TaxID=1684385 RepID=UPI0006C8B33A|nr:hypothetical protein [Novosphingobium sp. ST904]TCM28377.1 hypothetical protein EDF59_1296 [Novosphingobium sp. ST904]
MDLILVCITSAAEIAASLLIVAMACSLSVAAGQKTHHPFAAPVLMTALLMGCALWDGGGGIRVMVLAFGTAAAAFMILWIWLGDGPERGRVKKAPRVKWYYPALTARMGDLRSPSASELRHLLRRLSRELLTDGLSARAKARLIKGVARAALKQ